MAVQAVGTLTDPDNGGSVAGAWKTSGDLLDLDGDGLLEIVRYSGGAWQRHGHAVNGSPPRLLRRIRNGRGATTTVTYAAMTDSNIVTQTPAAKLHMPRAGWVVSSITEADSYEASAQTTDYRYHDPVYGPDAEVPADYGFRGFKKTRAILPAGQVGGQTGPRAVAVDEFSYDLALDPTGLKIRSTTYAGENQTVAAGNAGAPLTDANATSISETTYVKRGLFNNKVLTVVPHVSRSYTCYAGVDGQGVTLSQTQSQCLASPASLTVSETGYVDKASSNAGGPNLLVEATSTMTQDGLVFDSNDRETLTTTYLLTDNAASPPVYRLRTIESVSTVGLPGTTFARSQTTWDGTYRYVTEEKTYFDAATTAVTEYVVNGIGAVTSRKKPRQVETSGPSTSYTYDPSWRFVVDETNELGHVYTTATEPGTGAVTQKLGINPSPCVANNSCLPGAPTRDGVRTKIDGLGRPLEQWDAYSSSGSYVDTKTKTWSYVEPVCGTSSCTTQALVTARQLIQWNETRYSETRTLLDGHGRPTSMAVEAGALDAVTSYDYDTDGKLIKVTLPDPSKPAATAGTVDFAYTFDSLGRATGLRRPDSTTPSARSGVDVAYGPSIEFRTDVAGAGGGAVGRTRLISDAFGRLVEVGEQTNVAPGGGAGAISGASWAKTYYEYDERDAVVRVLEGADNLVETQMTHDWAGRRLYIKRIGGATSREWSFVYDKNGNLVSEVAPPEATVPGAPTPQELAKWTTTMVYDALDRMTSKVVAQRAILDADRANLGIGTWTLQWDVAGTNRKGRLYSSALVVPGTTMPVYSDIFNYDSFGNRRHSSTYSWAGHYTANPTPPTAAQRPMRAFLQEKTPTGQPWSTIYYDDNGGQTYSRSTTQYDDRGLPLHTVLIRTGLPNVTLGVQTRNVAGLVTKRLSDQAGMGLAMTKIQSDWQYDTLGRITQQVVSRDAAATLVAHQKLTYWGADDPKQLKHKIGTTAERIFDYAYDPRHQLTSATTGAGGVFSGTYTFGAQGRFATANITATALTGGEVKNRNVTYEYNSGVDREAVSALKSGGTNWATYTYYQDGGLKTRTYPATGETWTFLYDGDDQLKRVVKSVGASVTAKEDYLYTYDGARTVVVKRNASDAATEVRRFVGDQEAKFSPAGAVLETFAHVTMGTVLARVKDRTTYEHQFHGLGGSTLVAVATGGAVNTAFTYGPYGEVVEATGADTVGHRRRMNDKYQDEVSGLGYYGVRYYDQVLMGWTQGDPLYRYRPEAGWSEPRRGQLYAFNLRNPVRYVDPDGRNAGAAAARTAEVARLAAAVCAGSGGTLCGPALKAAAVATAAIVVVAVAEEAGEVVVDIGKGIGEGIVDIGKGIGDIISPVKPLDWTPPPLPIDEEKVNEPQRQTQPDSGPQQTGPTLPGPATDEPTWRTEDEHTKNPRESNRERHERGQKRKKRDKGGEKGDSRRKPDGRSKRPPNWPKGKKWPPPHNPTQPDTGSGSGAGSGGAT